MWDTATGAILAELPEASGPAGGGKAVVVTPDGRVFAAGAISGGRHAVVGWPSVRGGPPTVWSFAGSGGPRALAPDGSLAAVADGEGLSLYELRSDPGFRRPAGRLALPKTVGAVAFSPDGGRLAVGYGSEVGVWDLASGRKEVTLRGHGKSVGAVAFAPDRPLLLSGGPDGTARVWDLAVGRERACYDWGLGRVSAVAFAPDGLRAAAGGEGAVTVFDVE